MPEKSIRLIKWVTPAALCVVDVYYFAIIIQVMLTRLACLKGALCLICCDHLPVNCLFPTTVLAEEEVFKNGNLMFFV